MTSEQFLQFARPFPEPLLLLQSDGRILGANPSALSVFAAHGSLPDGTNLTEFTLGDPEIVIGYLHSCSRSREIVLGALGFRGEKGEQSHRAEGAVSVPGRRSFRRW